MARFILVRSTGSDVVFSYHDGRMHLNGISYTPSTDSMPADFAGVLTPQEWANQQFYQRVLADDAERRHPYEGDLLGTSVPGDHSEYAVFDFIMANLGRRPMRDRDHISPEMRSRTESPRGFRPCTLSAGSAATW